MTPRRSLKAKAHARLLSRAPSLHSGSRAAGALLGEVCFSDRKALLGVGGVAGLTVRAALPSRKVLVKQRGRRHVPLGRSSEDQQLAGGEEQVQLVSR